MRTIFCYTMDRELREAFRNAVEVTLGPQREGFGVGLIETLANGGNRHVAALVTAVDGLVDAVQTQLLAAHPPGLFTTYPRGTAV